MDGEPIDNEFDTSIPVDERDAPDEDGDGDGDSAPSTVHPREDDAPPNRSDPDAGLGGGVYDEPRSGAGPDLRDPSQDEHPTPTTGTP